MDIALVGVGKIARDQHIPTINTSSKWSLGATVSRSGSVPDVPAYSDLDALFTERPDIRVVSLCMPPRPRFDVALRALRAGRHVMLEKPPGVTLSECQVLATEARARGLSLFATWHSREAAMVQAAKSWLADQTLVDLKITWKEDVRRWHPGQNWIWEPGGMGVFDPGINALSILTEILPDPVHVTDARLEIPQGRQTPIAAMINFAHPKGAAVAAEFDWRQTGKQTWRITATTTNGVMTLDDGGAHLNIDGIAQRATPIEGQSQGEYPRLYEKMAACIAAGTSDFDLAPLRHVADAFMLGHREIVAAFQS